MNRKTEERMRLTAAAKWQENRLPFLTAFLTGLAAHGFAFSNKLLNHDEIESLFGKGATVTSGRWGLELVKLLFPDLSMPWIYGLISILLFSISACLMLRFLRIRSRPLQALLAAMILCFPSLTGNFCFMFTSAPYAWSFFLTVLAVALFSPQKPASWSLSTGLLVLALGIYQAYIAVAATLFVLRMIADTLDGEKNVGAIVVDGVRALALLIGAVLLYIAVTLLVFHFTGEAFNSYVTENVGVSAGILRRVRMACDAFYYIFSFRYFYLITSEAARYLHIGLLLLTAAGLAVLAIRFRNALRAALLAVLVLMLPLSICCMFLIMSQESIHTLVLYGFVGFYFLSALCAERIGLPGKTGAETLLAAALALIIIGNVYFSNMVYLKLHLQYENASAFYTTLCARVQGTDGFDEHCSLALVGRQENLVHFFPELDTDLFMGVNRELVNIYSRENFVHRYLGFDIPFASDERLESLEKDPRVLEMAEYPYYGSVQRIDDCIVVRLG